MAPKSAHVCGCAQKFVGNFLKRLQVPFYGALSQVMVIICFSAVFSFRPYVGRRLVSLAAGIYFATKLIFCAPARRRRRR